MKLSKNVFPWILMLVITSVAADEKELAAKQAELDEACEVARQIELAPIRQQHIDECVEKQDKNKAECEKFYQDYGVRTGNRVALFYDLPECVEAFEYNKAKNK